MQKPADVKRRHFLGLLGIGAGTLAAGGCSDTPPPERFTNEDQRRLDRQRDEEAASTGKGPLGKQVYAGYRGLAELPWFELDDRGRLFCSDERVPESIDVHCHLGMSVLFEPRLDLQAKHPRTRHLLDCDGEQPPCRLDLDVYANGNFSDSALSELRRHTIAQALWGSPFSKTQTIPNLLDEMDAMRVAQALILPIKMGLPFGDRQTEQWRDAIRVAGAQGRLVNGLSVHPRDESRLEEMRGHAATGARLMKLHPTVQAFYPDEDSIMPLYEEANRLNLVIFFHGGRAGIEPQSRQPYAVVRHYEAVLSTFSNLPVILGHAGARDSEAMVELAMRYDNAWLGIHGQSVTRLGEIIERTGGKRLLFGTDWPFYHIGMSLAKVLLCTQRQGSAGLRRRILRDNALDLFPELRELEP